MFIEAVLDHAARRPADIAALDQTRQITFRELALGANLMAGHVENVSANPGRLGLLIPQSCAFAVAFFGTWWAGSVPVPLNYLLSPPELLHILRDAGIETVFTVRHFQPLADAIAAAGIRVVFMEDLSFKKIPWKRPVPAHRDDDMALLVYTSGTSAQPKGVMLSFGNLEANARDSVDHARFREQMVFLGMLPMFHTLALTATLLAPAMLGCKVVYLPRFSPPAIFQIIQEHQIQVMIAVPSMYAALLDSKTAAGGASLQPVTYAVSGGEALPPALAENFEKRFGVAILEGFGLTETSAANVLSLPWAKKTGSVGQPLPHVDLRVVDEAGEVLPVNVEGELLIRSPTVMLGYYNKPAETEAVFTSDRFFRTGDLARIDADGYLFITGRKKDLINMAGEKIAPREIEDVIAQHPAVAAAAVIAMPDPQRGEAPAAFVQWKDGADPKPTEQELRTFIRGHLAGYKVPRNIYIVTEMPLSPTGKIVKRLLKPPAGD